MTFEIDEAEAEEGEGEDPVSDDESGSEPIKQEVVPEYSEVDFQVDRWRTFYKWVGGLEDSMAANVAFMSDYEVRAAADATDLKKLSDAQVVTLDLSVSKKLDGLRMSGRDCAEFKRTMNRSNILVFTIYSAHSFKSKDDFYIVEAKMTTAPRNFQDTAVRFTDGERNTMVRNFVYGYTKEAGFRFEIDDGSKLSASDLSLIENHPENVNKSTTREATTSVSLSGSVGVSKNGPSVEVGGSVSYSDTTKWTTSEYEIVNTSLKGSFEQAAWKAVFDYCGDGKEHGYEGIYRGGGKHNGKWYGVNATPASKETLTLPAYGVFQVKEGYWRKQPAINLTGGLDFQDGCTLGPTLLYTHWSHLEWISYGRWNRTDSGTQKFSFELKQPPHAAVTQRKFDLNSNATSKVSFTLYAEDSWTITDIPDWLTFTQTSGDASGETGTLIYAQANKNTGKDPRSAKVILTCQATNAFDPLAT